MSWISACGQEQSLADDRFLSLFSEAPMPNPVSLDQIFGAFVNQGTLEDAAHWMAELAAKDDGLAREVRRALEDGIESAKAGDADVAASVNRSGYKVSTVAEASELCEELLRLFLAEPS